MGARERGSNAEPGALQVNISFEKGFPLLKYFASPRLTVACCCRTDMHRESRELASSLDFPTHLLSGPGQVGLGFGCVICEGGQMGHFDGSFPTFWHQGAHCCPGSLLMETVGL